MIKLAFGAALGLLVFCGAAQARDAFDGVRCGADIPKALIGKVLPDGPAADIEGRHKALALADEGGDEMENGIAFVSWGICGHSYNMLVNDKSVIRDVVAADHSRAMPAFAGVCQVNGKDTAATGLYAVLDNKAGAARDPHAHYNMDDKTLLPAVLAWRVDEKHGKFVALPVAGMMCPRSGLATADGGS